MCKVALLLTIALLINVANSDRAKRLRQAKESHERKELSDADIDKLGQTLGEQHFKEVLMEILIPRVVGTPNHTKVGNYIVKQLLDLGWDVEQDTFTDQTPSFGKLNFRNIIARLNPHADRYLVLACHYDSKYFREHAFVGATDSAVPCAMLLSLAYTLRQPLASAARNTDLSLQLIFFDGEEAFRQWGPKDSIYGARHLARLWQNTPYPAGEETTELHRMDILVLLDLLGASDPSFYNYFGSTERWYARLAAAERALASRGHLVNYSRGSNEQTYFKPYSSGAHVEDDHVPFLQRNVPVLHVIPTPFPPQWHQPEDDYASLDFATIHNLNKIFRVFVAEYLHLDV